MNNFRKNMGSVPSTPDSTDDPWWPIENQHFSLDQSPLLNVVEMDRQGQSAGATDETEENCEIQVDRIENNSENLNSDCENRNINKADEQNESSAEGLQSVERKEQTLEEFKEELRIKREKRQGAIADLRNEITSLRQELAEEKELNRQLKQQRNCSSTLASDTLETEEIIEATPGSFNQDDETEQIHSDRSNITLKRELANVQLSLQLANSEVLSLQAELNVRQKQAETLKEVNVVSKQMIQIREDQLNQVSENRQMNFLESVGLMFGPKIFRQNAKKASRRLGFFGQKLFFRKDCYFPPM